jgi:hypothetical protein
MATLASADELADYLQRTLSADEAIAATFALEVATSMIQGWTGQHFLEVVDDTITVWPRAGVVLLPELPVTTVTTVTTKDGAPVAHTLRNDGALHLEGRWSEFVTITYTHGYAPEDIPAAVKGAAIQIAAGTMSNPQAYRQRQHTAGPFMESVTYAGDGAAGGAANWKQLVSPYRMTRMA